MHHLSDSTSCKKTFWYTTYTVLKHKGRPTVRDDSIFLQMTETLQNDYLSRPTGRLGFWSKKYLKFLKH